nr:hypothetical protein [Marseillevirus cajuinensis]WRK65534.1 hypothetical protein MarFTME_489 [Marseillevirus futianmevirus]
MEEFLQKRETLSWFINEDCERPEKARFEKQEFQDRTLSYAYETLVWKTLPNGERTHRTLFREDMNFTVVETCPCKDGLPHGKMQEYTTEKRTDKTYLSREADFVDGVLHGELWIWKSDSLLSSRITFRKGKILEGNTRLHNIVLFRGKKPGVSRRTLDLQYYGRRGRGYINSLTVGDSFSEEHQPWPENSFLSFHVPKSFRVERPKVINRFYEGNESSVQEYQRDEIRFFVGATV